MNNAGISSAPTAETLREQYASIYNTNLFGVAVLTEAFTPLLRASTLPGGKRIIFVSTTLSSLNLATAKDTGTPANQYPLYRSSKTALNMIMANYHAELAKEGFVVGGLCPGFCSSESPCSEFMWFFAWMMSSEHVTDSCASESELLRRLQGSEGRWAHNRQCCGGGEG